MDEDALNMSVRKFLKAVGVTSQREIEKAIRAAAEEGRLPEAGKVGVSARVVLDGFDVDIVIDGEIRTG